MKGFMHKIKQVHYYNHLNIAQKTQVLHMVKIQLPGAEIAGPDAADALAIAICHAHHGAVSPQLAKTRMRA